MMMSLMLVLADQPIIVPMVSPPTEITPTMMTKPILQFDCRIIGESGRSFPLIWRVEGRQGFYSAFAKAREFKIAEKTDATYRIVEDKSGRLSLMKFQGYGNLLRIGATFRDSSGNSVVFGSDYENKDKSGKASLFYYFYPKGSRKPEAFAGPCRVTEIDQLPLDHDPNEK